jgi:hypothetical protein
VVMIRVPTLTDQHRQDHARVLIMACRLHPPPPACRDGHRIPSRLHPRTRRPHIGTRARDPKTGCRRLPAGPPASPLPRPRHSREMSVLGMAGWIRVWPGRGWRPGCAYRWSSSPSSQYRTTPHKVHSSCLRLDDEFGLGQECLAEGPAGTRRQDARQRNRRPWFRPSRPSAPAPSRRSSTGSCAR